MAICTIQGSLVNPGAVGKTGTLFIELNQSESIDTGSGISRAVAQAPIAIKVNNGTVVPTAILTTSSGITALVTFKVGTQIKFSKVCSIIAVGGIFDVGLGL